MRVFMMKKILIGRRNRQMKVNRKSVKIFVNSLVGIIVAILLRVWLIR